MIEIFLTRKSQIEQEIFLITESCVRDCSGKPPSTAAQDRRGAWNVKPAPPKKLVRTKKLIAGTRPNKKTAKLPTTSHSPNSLTHCVHLFPK